MFLKSFYVTGLPISILNNETFFTSIYKSKEVVVKKRYFEKITQLSDTTDNLHYYVT